LWRGKMIFKAKIAEMGDHILFKKAIKGIVEKVNENSVIVNITENKTELKFEGNRTVVAHKNYKILVVHDVNENVIYTQF
jgi:uncharacterized protein YkvS